MSSSNFRYDINALRAIAVIAVVLFHFNPDFVPGGFAGVDVFFVISGFLMTGIVFRGLEANNFNLLHFYIARAKRIIPALLVLVLFSLTAGYFLLASPNDYSLLAKHSLSSIGFFSNITYWLESGYFDANPRDKWLLHTWSLSVEWQFYIIYPVVLLVLSRFFSNDTLKKIILVGTFLGFTFSVYATSQWANASYYLLPTRAWEMMFGGVAYLFPVCLKNKQKQWVSLIGLGMVVISYFSISSDTPWPGYIALVPVLGTYLMIISDNQDSFLTRNKVFQSIGTWSYSIYLWHWPFVVVLYLYGVNNNIFIQGAMVFLSVFSGFLSYKVIEQSQQKKVHVLTFSSALIVSTFVSLTNVAPLKYKYVQGAVDTMVRKPYECFDKQYSHNQETVTCNLTNGHGKLLALGDSHMYSLLPVLEEISYDNGIDLSYVGYSGCPPLIGVYPIKDDQITKDCYALNKKIMQHTKTNGVDTVFLSARWSYYIDGSYNDGRIQFLSLKSASDIASRNDSIKAFEIGLEKTLSEFFSQGIKVFVLLQVPMQHREPLKIYHEAILSSVDIDKALRTSSVKTRKHNELQSLANSIIERVSSKFDNVTLLDPTSTFCDSEFCTVGDLNTSYYFDDDHVSILGAYKLRPKIENVLLVDGKLAVQQLTRPTNVMIR